MHNITRSISDNDTRDSDNRSNTDTMEDKQ